MTKEIYVERRLCRNYFYRFIDENVEDSASRPCRQTYHQPSPMRKMY